VKRETDGVWSVERNVRYWQSARGLRYVGARSGNRGNWQENLHPYGSVSTHPAHYHPGLSTSAFSSLSLFPFCFFVAFLSLLSS